VELGDFGLALKWNPGVDMKQNYEGKALMGHSCTAVISLLVTVIFC